MNEPRLHVDETGGGDQPPLVFLHGFDGRAAVFENVAAVFAGEGRRCLAFDLPGHGRSRAFPGFGPPKIAARAVLAELQHRGIPKAHVVGHSMGGAVGCLMALFDPARVASLTLLAPGGFGPEIGVGQLRSMMEATDTVERIAAVNAMTAKDFAASEACLKGCNGSEGRQEIRTIFELLFGSGTQGVLPLDAIAATGVPVEILWGEKDSITPVTQSEGLPQEFAVTRLAGAGHMLPLEAPGETVAAIGRAVARATA